MDSRILAAVAAGHGLVTAHSLRQLQVTAQAVAAMVRAGDLVAVRRGVYTTHQLWNSWDEYAARPLARIRAAELTLDVPHVFSHDSAAILQGVPLLDSRRSEVHVTRPDAVNGSRLRYGVRHHGARYAPEQVHRVRGLDVLDVPRTVVDLTRCHGYRAGLVAADGAMQLGVTRSALTAAAQPLSYWPGVTTVRAVIEDADPGAESVAETLGRELVRELGIGEPETQFPVRTASGVVWCDLRVGCHVFEVDGRAKSRAVADGGLATGDLERLLWEERRRQREVCGEGLGMSRIVWADYWGEARERAKARLQREVDVTRQRFGPTLPPHLEAFAQGMRGRRYRVAG